MGSGGTAPPFLTSTLDGIEWSALRLGRFTPDIHFIGNWVGPRDSLEAVEREKIVPPLEIKPDSPARSPSLYRLSFRPEKTNKKTALHENIKLLPLCNRGGLYFPGSLASSSL
jgi:hypothetical protein